MGPRLLTLIATLTGEFHLSTRRIQRLLAEQYQLHFSVGAISEAQGKMNAPMVEPYQAIGRHLRAQDIVHADELIGGFSGLLMTDDSGGYNDVPRHRRHLTAHCSAHNPSHCRRYEDRWQQDWLPDSTIRSPAFALTCSPGAAR